MSKIYVDEIAPKTTGGAISREKYYFMVRKNNGNVTVNTDIVFNQVDEDTQGIYNSSNGVITVPAAGIWQFNFSVISNASGQTGVGVYNASTTQYFKLATYGESTNNTDMSFSFALNLSAGDTVKMRCIGGTVYGGSGSGHAHFNGYLVL